MPTCVTTSPGTVDRESVARDRSRTRQVFGIECALQGHAQGICRPLRISPPGRPRLDQCGPGRGFWSERKAFDDPLGVWNRTKRLRPTVEIGCDQVISALLVVCTVCKIYTLTDTDSSSVSVYHMGVPGSFYALGM